MQNLKVTTVFMSFAYSEWIFICVYWYVVRSFNAIIHTNIDGRHISTFSHFMGRVIPSLVKLSSSSTKKWSQRSTYGLSCQSWLQIPFHSIQKWIKTDNDNNEDISIRGLCHVTTTKGWLRHFGFTFNVRWWRISVPLTNVYVTPLFQSKRVKPWGLCLRTQYNNCTTPCRGREDELSLQSSSGQREIFTFRSLKKTVMFCSKAYRSVPMVTCNSPSLATLYHDDLHRKFVTQP